MHPGLLRYQVYSEETIVSKFCITFCNLNGEEIM